MKANHELRKIVAERVGKLQELEARAVEALPDLTSESVGPIPAKVHQYHDVLGSGEHMVVVQALCELWFGISTAIEVGGFVMSSDGTKRPLREEETRDFI